jgi:uncharacterized protein (TIGR02271 family)
MHTEARSADHRSTVVGVFRNPDDVRRAVSMLKDAGFSANDVSVLAPERDDTRAIAEETGTRAGGGAATGALAGGILGGLGGWLVGIGALAIPGVGPLIAAGAFATALGGAALGTGVGAIAGALVGMGVPQEHARYYEDEVRGGRTLLTVRADGRYDEAQRLLRSAGAYDVESQSAPSPSAASVEAPSEATREVAGGEQARLQLREEELHARTRPVQTGQVSVGKDVVTEDRTLEVPVRREEVFIERRPVERRTADSPLDDAGQTVEVPLRQEQVQLEKRPVVYEEVEVGKRQHTESRQVSESVRREEAHVERTGSAPEADAESTDRDRL